MEWGRGQQWRKKWKRKGYFSHAPPVIKETPDRNPSGKPSLNHSPPEIMQNIKELGFGVNQHSIRLTGRRYRNPDAWIWIRTLVPVFCSARFPYCMCTFVS